MITDNHLLSNKPHPSGLGGSQRIYRLGGNFGLSLVNSPILHVYPFAWEAAVIGGLKDDGSFDDIVYDTPLTDDVEVFSDDEEANDFIERAAKYFKRRKEKK